MKLQLAIDELSLDQALSCLEELAPHLDIIEVGTPFLLDAGREAVKCIKEKFPNKQVLCDAKIMDAGIYESKLAFDAGADYVTVLGITDNRTISGCVSEAHGRGKKVVADMICVKDYESRVPEIESLGIDIIAVHTGADQQKAGRTPIADLRELKKYVKTAQIAVAGGINSHTVNQYIELQPDIVIIGGGILNSESPIKELLSVYSQINS